MANCNKCGGMPSFDPGYPDCSNPCSCQPQECNPCYSDVGATVTAELSSMSLPVNFCDTGCDQMLTANCIVFNDGKTLQEKMTMIIAQIENIHATCCSPGNQGGGEVCQSSGTDNADIDNTNNIICIKF